MDIFILEKMVILGMGANLCIKKDTVRNQNIYRNNAKNTDGVCSIFVVLIFNKRGLRITNISIYKKTELNRNFFSLVLSHRIIKRYIKYPSNVKIANNTIVDTIIDNLLFIYKLC